MARIFVPTTGGWEVQPLEGALHRLRRAEGRAVELRSADPERAAADGGALLLRVPELSDAGGAGWVVVPDTDVGLLVNGEPIATGLALLRDRDELRLGGSAPLYLSTERLAAVEECARDDAPRCPRCAQPIARGDPSVCCPGCGVLHHELPERNCWTYLPTCALCARATDPSSGLRWTPEEP